MHVRVVQGDEAEAEGGEMPQTLDDDVEEAVVGLQLVVQTLVHEGGAGDGRGVGIERGRAAREMGGRGVEGREGLEVERAGDLRRRGGFGGGRGGLASDVVAHGGELGYVVKEKVIGEGRALRRSVCRSAGLEMVDRCTRGARAKERRRELVVSRTRWRTTVDRGRT